METDPNPTNQSQNEINDTSVHSNNQIEHNETPRQDQSQALETEQQAEISQRAEEEPENNEEEEENNDEQNEENQENEAENVDQQEQEEEEQNEEKQEEQEENEVEAGKDLILDGLANAILGEDAANPENKEELMNAFGQALLQPADKEDNHEPTEQNDENNEKNEEDNQRESVQPEAEEEQEKPKEPEHADLEDVAKTPTKSTKSSSQGKRHFDTKEQETPAVTHREESQNVTPRAVESKPKEEKPATPVAAVPIVEEIVVVQEPVEEPPKFDSLQEAFKSVSEFFSTTEKNIEKTSASLFSKLKEVPALIKKAQEKPKVEEKPQEPETVQAEEKAQDSHRQPQEENASKSRTIDEHNLRMQRMKEMKKNFESQVNDLNKGLENLERVEANLEGADDKTKKLGPLKTKKSHAELPLFMKMEKEFQEKQVLPELERRKVELKAKKELYKPMDEKAIREHALKYQELAKKDMVNRQVARLESDKSKAERVEKAQKLYKSVALNKILEQEKEQKVKDEKRLEEIKQKKDKQLQYGKLVKEIYFPKVEQKDGGLTKETIRQLIERSERVHASPPKYMPPVKNNNNNYEIYPAKTRINRISQEQIKQFEGILDNTPNVPQNQLYGHKGYLYRKAAQKRVSPPHKAASAEDKSLNKHPEAVEDRGEEFSQERGQVEIKKKLSPPRRSGDDKLMRIGKKKAEEKEKSPEPEVVVEKKSYPNYLEEIKKKRVEQERKGNRAKYVHWEKTMKNKGMSKQEKMMTILDEVGRLEHQMKIKEEKLKAMEIPGNMNPMELEEQVGEMYLESIKAKLAIIKGFAV